MLAAHEDWFASAAVVARARQSLHDTGCYLFDQRYDQQTCAEITAWMDERTQCEPTEVNYAGSEHRIWGAEKLSNRVAQFCAESDRFMSALRGSDNRAFTILAIRNQPVDPRNSGVQQGRWHIDSFRNQYKTFVFLTDVDAASGPFEYIPGSQTWLFRARMAASGAYFRPADLFSDSRSYSRLPDERVARLLGRGYQPRPILCRAGTIMVVNTTAIHRARPCLAGGRYALTAYYK